MGDFVTFRNKGRGRVEEDSDAVSITDPRVKFIKGWETGGTDPEDGSVECGDGTAYPLEVTVEQLEAIFHGVKDSKVTDGAFTHDASFGDPLVPYFQTLTMSSDDPADAFGESADEYYTLRSYCTFIGGVSPDVPMSNYGSDLLGDTYYLQASSVGGVSSAPLAVRDAVAEFALRLNYDRLIYGPETITSPLGHFDVGYKEDDFDNFYEYILPYYNLKFIIANHESYGAGSFKTGFSLISEASGVATSGYRMTGDGSDDGTPNYGEGAINIAFTGRVAFIDVAGNGNPFDPTNRLFVGMEISIIGYDGYFAPHASTNLDGLAPSGVYNATTTVELNFGTSGVLAVSCPLYISVDYSVINIVPFVIKATKWWPYAKEDGTPMYSETTGLPL